MATLNEDYFERLLFVEFTKNERFAAVAFNKLDPRIFTNKSYERVAWFYKKFWQEHGRKPNKVDLGTYLKGVDEAAAFREAFNTVKDIDWKEADENDFLKNAELFIKRRQTILVLQEVIAKHSNNSITSDEVVRKFENVAALKLIQTIGFDIYKDIEKYIENTQNSGAKLSTGFEMIDKYTNGGLPADGKFLGIISAPTNMGKSIFLGNLAVNACKQEKNVLVVSLEMSEMVYATRIYSALYGMNIAELPLKHDELREKVAGRKYGNMIIKEFPPGTLTAEELEGYIDDVQKHEGYKFDLICVDYLTLLSAPSADSSNEAGKRLARKLRALSYKYECPVFTAAQINRDGFGLTPDMKYMAESIAICSEADLILSLYQNEEDVALNLMRLWFLKSRLGRKDVSVKLYFNTASLRFESIVEDGLDEKILVDDGGKPSKIVNNTSSLMETIDDVLNSD